MPRGRPVINLHLLGPVSLDGAEALVARRLPHEPVRFSVLVFIAACRNGYASRDRLLSLLWPDQPRPRALNSLRQSVHRIRACVGSSAVLTLGKGDLDLSPSVIEVDVREFIRAHGEGRHEDAMALYAGSFLGDFASTGRPEFDDWVGYRREELRRIARRNAVLLARRTQAEGRLSEAGAWWECAMSLSDHDEVILRCWMECLAQQGAPARALAVYERAVEGLWRHLEVGAAPETAALAAAIRGKAFGGAPRSRREVLTTRPADLPLTL